jgi:hypothetical protein
MTKRTSSTTFGPLSTALKLFAYLSATLSTIRLIWKFLDIGVAPILADFLDFYHKLVAPLAWPLTWLSVPIPDWYADFCALGLVGAFVLSTSVKTNGTWLALYLGIDDDYSIPRWWRALLTASPAIFGALAWVGVTQCIVGLAILYGAWSQAHLPLVLYGRVRHALVPYPELAQYELFQRPPWPQRLAAAIFTPLRTPNGLTNTAMDAVWVFLASLVAAGLFFGLNAYALGFTA